MLAGGTSAVCVCACERERATWGDIKLASSSLVIAAMQIHAVQAEVTDSETVSADRQTDLGTAVNSNLCVNAELALQ